MTTTCPTRARGCRLALNTLTIPAAALILAVPASAGADARVAEAVEPGAGTTAVRLDVPRLREHAASRGTLTLEALPLAGGEPVDLQLERFFVTRPDTRFVVVGADGGERALDFDPDSVVLLRGSVPGEPGSSAFLAIGPQAVQGRVDLGPGASYTLASVPAAADDAGTPILIRSAAAASAPRGDCGIDVPTTDGMAFGTGPMIPPGGIRQIELALETDYEYFSLFGESDAATAYLLQLYGAVSDIFIRDVRATFVITFIRLWETPDDLFNQENPLNAFLGHWNDNMDHVSRNTAQLVSGRRNMPFGGIAYVNVLCNQSFAYSVIAYTLGDFADTTRPNPFNRDITLASHELGHVVAVPHTHSVGIDECDDPSTTPQRGTIMSYCGQTFTGGSANMDLRFHAVMSETMRSAVAQSACLGDDCNLNGVADADEILAGTATDLNDDGVLDECQDCNDNGVLDAIDIASLLSLDLNANGVPDECEPDCNGNDQPDDLDLAGNDAYGDGVPDECEEDCDGDGQSDYAQIQQDMSLDLDRNARLDSCEDCDGNGTADLVDLAGANNLWVADLAQPRLRQYLWLTGTESRVSDDAALVGPNDVLAAPDGRVLVTSGVDDRIVEFAADGSLIGDLLPMGSGLVSHPAGMTFTPGGDLLVASRDSSSVVRFDAKGAYAGVFVSSGAGGLTAPFGLAFGPDGHLHVTSDDGRVLRYDGATGAFLDEFVTASDNGGLAEPHGLAFLPSGELLVASYGTDQVLRYGPDGSFAGQFNVNGTATVLTLDQPWCIRIGVDGGVYVSRAHDHASATGGEDGGPATPSGTEPLHLTNARLYHFDPGSGNLLRAFVQGANSNLSNPTGFDFLPASGVGTAADCNGNLVPDACDIAGGASLDRNGDGVPDECAAPCAADVDGSGVVDVDDLVTVILQWGTDGGEGGDVDGSGSVTVDDLVAVILAWGPCP